MNNNNTTSVTSKSCILYASGVNKKKECISGYAFTIIEKNIKVGSSLKVYSRFSGNKTNYRAILLGINSGLLKAISLGYDNVEIRTENELIFNMINKEWLSRWENNNWKKMDNGEIKHLDLIMILHSYTQSVNVSASWVSENSNDDILEIVYKYSQEAQDSVEETSNDVFDYSKCIP